MLPEDEFSWQQWLTQYTERMKILCFLQEEAICRQDWSELQQLLQEQEQILDVLWQAPPSQLTAEVLTFAQDLWQINQHLQQMMEERMSALRAEIAFLHRVRDTAQRYQNSSCPSGLEDRTA